MVLLMTEHYPVDVWINGHHVHYAINWHTRPARAWPCRQARWPPDTVLGEACTPSTAASSPGRARGVQGCAGPLPHPHRRVSREHLLDVDHQQSNESYQHIACMR